MSKPHLEFGLGGAHRMPDCFRHHQQENHRVASAKNDASESGECPDDSSQESSVSQHSEGQSQPRSATPQSVLDEIREKVQRGEYLTRSAAELSAERIMDADDC